MDFEQSKLPTKPSLVPRSNLIATCLAERRRSQFQHPSTPPSISDLSSSIAARLHPLSKSTRGKRYHSLNITPSISATSYCVIDQSTSKWLYGVNDLQVREVASLTKIMTCILSLSLSAGIENSLSTVITVSQRASAVGGTKAALQEGDSLTLKDLLFGLMLPSGNDAALALAEYFGSRLVIGTTKPIRRFVSEMNKTAKEVGMPLTHFANPHGLMHKKNLSSARDICKLACYALKDSVFRDIVNCRSYVGEIRGKDGFLRYVKWKNTNKLLAKGFDGVKTGITLTAGPCLCASIRREKSMVLVLLNSKSMEDRWIDAKKLSEWALNKFYY